MRKTCKKTRDDDRSQDSNHLALSLHSAVIFSVVFSILLHKTLKRLELHLQYLAKWHFAAISRLISPANSCFSVLQVTIALFLGASWLFWLLRLIKYPYLLTYLHLFHLTAINTFIIVVINTKNNQIMHKISCSVLILFLEPYWGYKLLFKIWGAPFPPIPSHFLSHLSSLPFYLELESRGYSFSLHRVWNGTAAENVYLSNDNVCIYLSFHTQFESNYSDYVNVNW